MTLEKTPPLKILPDIYRVISTSVEIFTCFPGLKSSTVTKWVDGSFPRRLGTDDALNLKSVSRSVLPEDILKLHHYKTDLICQKQPNSKFTIFRQNSLHIHIRALVRERFSDVTLEVAQLLNKRSWYLCSWRGTLYTS